jgi:NodT family efflux transporter outer membrane factor (OMF) lipoprotein
MNTMFKKSKQLLIGASCMLLVVTACKTPELAEKAVQTNFPEHYAGVEDTTNTATIQWRAFFTDLYLQALIDTALAHNQELNITLQEIEVARNEVRARKGEYLPFVGVRGAAGVDKVGRYTSRGSSEATTDIMPGTPTPDPLQDYLLELYASWEVDIWHKLRNAKQAAFNRYLGSIEGKNFMVTQLVAEIANTYYELLALDNQLEIVKRNIQLQSDALEIVKLQKQSARVTELAVRKFEAEVFHTRSLQYDIQQRITETENRLNFLVGRYPQYIPRNTDGFADMVPNAIEAGLPAQLLQYRPDVRQAELELIAAKLDVKSAKANFYPSLSLTAGAGFQAFNPNYLITTPQSLLYSMAGDLTAPLLNRNAIKATYYSANAKQLQTVYNYERTVLNAYIEVVNQLSNLRNLEQRYALKSQEVDALTESIGISGKLFKSARADYMEVLLTQRDALESKFDLVETKQQQMQAVVHLYQALGGGWK